MSRTGAIRCWRTAKLGREHYDPDKPRQPDQKKRDMENRTGEKSAHRIAIEDGAAIIKQAQTWEQLHRELAAKGMRYEKTGSGATVFVGDVGVKASDVDRNASLAKMQKRLGAYQPAPQRQQVAQREPEPIKPDVPGWKDYITGRKAHYAEKNAAKLAQDKRQEQERKQLAEQQKARRDELMRGNWKGKGEVLNAMRSVIAAEQAAEKAALKEKHQKEREQHRQRFRPLSRPGAVAADAEKPGACRAVAAPGQRAAAHRGRPQRAADAARHSRLCAGDRRPAGALQPQATKAGRGGVCLSWTRARASTFTTGATGTARLPPCSYRRRSGQLHRNRERRIQGHVREVSSRARLQDHESRASGEHPAGAAADTAGEGAGDEIGAAKAVRAVRGSGRRGALPGDEHQDAARTAASKPSSSTRRTASRGASRRRRSSSARRRCSAYSAGAKTSTTRRYRTRSITS